MAKRFDPKAKARKQKIVAAVLGVLLLGVIVYQAPTILGLFGGGSSEVASEPAPPPPPGSAPAPVTPAAGAPAAPVPVGSAELVDSDPAPAASQSQLVTFDRFESKDPFAQQAEQSQATDAPAPSGAPDEGGLPPSVTEPEPQAPSPSPATSTLTAEISVNGVSSDVTVAGTFPAADPIFKLISLTKSTAKVGIVEGTYATGSEAITLKKGGKPVTLMNTADGTTYILRLLSVA
jgi:hypothetical protein